jgi:hypothetical protein
MDELSAGEPADLRGRTGAPVGWPEEDRRRYKEYWDSTNIDELEVEQGELQSGRLAIVRDILDAELGTAADLIVELRALASRRRKLQVLR